MIERVLLSNAYLCTPIMLTIQLEDDIFIIKSGKVVLHLSCDIPIRCKSECQYKSQYSQWCGAAAREADAAGQHEQSRHIHL